MKGVSQEEINARIERIEVNRRNSVDIFRNLQKKADFVRSQAYGEAYEEVKNTIVRPSDDSRRGGKSGKTPSGEPSKSTPEGTNERSLRSASGRPGSSAGPGLSDSGVRQPSTEVSDLVAQRAAQDKRIAALEAEKAEREAEKERALERRNLAVQRRAEASGSKKAILARVPDDAKALAGEVLSRVQMGSASYVLGANRERLPATPAR